MKRKTFALGLMALVLVPAASAVGQQGQQREAERRSERAREELEKARRAASAFGYAFAFDDRDRPRLGITTESSGLRDTLGLLVTDVTEDGPAAKAGLEEGDRIQSVNGVNLRLAREDAGEEDMEGIATRRLIRALGKAKIGDEVELRVWHDGALKTLRVKTVSIDELEGRTRREFEGPDRASLGIGLGSSGSRRDTLGILVSSVVDDGPAAKAGLLEGDRIQSINDVDLRVPGEDAGDWAMSSARARRLTRELEKLKPGDEVTLRVYSGGSTKTVRVKTVSSRDLPMEHSFFFGDMPGRTMVFPRGQMIMPSTPRALPGVTRYRLSPVEADVRRKIEQTLPKVTPLLRKVGSRITI